MQPVRFFFFSSSHTWPPVRHIFVPVLFCLLALSLCSSFFFQFTESLWEIQYFLRRRCLSFFFCFCILFFFLATFKLIFLRPLWTHNQISWTFSLEVSQLSFLASVFPSYLLRAHVTATGCNSLVTLLVISNSLHASLSISRPPLSNSDPYTTTVSALTSPSSLSRSGWRTIKENPKRVEILLLIFIAFVLSFSQQQCRSTRSVLHSVFVILYAFFLFKFEWVFFAVFRLSFLKSSWTEKCCH